MGDDIAVRVVPSLTSMSLDTILTLVQMHKYHPQVINDLCRYLQGAQHLLNPILESLIQKKVITDVALVAFLVPDRYYLTLASCSHIKKSTLKQIGYNCPHLVSLDLSDCAQVSNAVVRSILTGCGCLREFHLNRCRMVTDSAFEPEQSPFLLLVGCQSLETISMQGCSQVTGRLAHVLAKTCRHLRELNLAQCKNIRAPSLQSLFQHSCFQLQRLDLSFSQVISDESFISPHLSAGALSMPSLVTTASSCSGRLEHLTLDMSSISDVALTRLALKYGHSLQELSLQWCSSITDSGVEVLAAHCLLLRDLNLRECKGLTDASVRSIGQQCCGLERLDLSYCGAISDYGILQLTPGQGSACGLLRTLLARWTGMTGRSLGLAGGGLLAMPELKEVMAAGCDGIEEDCVTAFQRKGVSLII